MLCCDYSDEEVVFSLSCGYNMRLSARSRQTPENKEELHYMNSQ